MGGRGTGIVLFPPFFYDFYPHLWGGNVKYSGKLVSSEIFFENNLVCLHNFYIFVHEEIRLLRLSDFKEEKSEVLQIISQTRGFGEKILTFQFRLQHNNLCAVHKNYKTV